MKLFSWNVNGIRAVINKGQFDKFIKQYDPDILCIQETKAHREQVEINLPEYSEYWNSAEKKGYSGTAIFSKTKPLTIIKDIPEDIVAKHSLAKDDYGHPNNEGRVLAVEFDSFFVVTVYTPNSKGDLSRLDLRHKFWDPAFLDYVNKLQQSKPVVFSGDLNVAHQEIDLANPKANVGKHGFTNEEREGFDNILGIGFVDSFRLLHPDQKDAYSWWTHWANARARNVGWRIDYWLFSKQLKDKVKSAAIHPEQMGSDHCPVSIELDL